MRNKDGLNQRRGQQAEEESQRSQVELSDLKLTHSSSPKRNRKRGDCVSQKEQMGWGSKTPR